MSASMPLDSSSETNVALPPSKVLDDARYRLELRVASVVLGLPHVGAVLALVKTVGWGITLEELAIFLGMYVVTVFGVIVGFHRHFSHRAFKAVPAVRAALAIMGSFAWQGPVIRWAADHRRHHQFTDEEGDPHSPHPGGFWFAHIGWLFGREKTTVRRYAPDLLADPFVRQLDRGYWLWALASLAIPTALGAWLVPGPYGWLGGLLWGGFVRIVAVHHATWLANSWCHVVGPQPFETRDESRNSAVVSLLLLGGGWHNNHHAFPSSAVAGVEWWQFDPSFWLIRALAWMGLASDVQRPRPADVASRRKTA